MHEYGTTLLLFLSSSHNFLNQNKSVPLFTCVCARVRCITTDRISAVSRSRFADMCRLMSGRPQSALSHCATGYGEEGRRKGGRETEDVNVRAKCQIAPRVPRLHASCRAGDAEEGRRSSRGQGGHDASGCMRMQAGEAARVQPRKKEARRQGEEKNACPTPGPLVGQPRSRRNHSSVRRRHTDPLNHPRN